MSFLASSAVGDRERWSAITEEHWRYFIPYISSGVKRVPLLRQAEHDHLLNTPDAFTPDGRWIMGETPEVTNYFVCAGMNGNSLQVNNHLLWSSFKKPYITIKSSSWPIDKLVNDDYWKISHFKAKTYVLRPLKRKSFHTNGCIMRPIRPRAEWASWWPTGSSMGGRRRERCYSSKSNASQTSITLGTTSLNASQKS